MPLTFVSTEEARAASGLRMFVVGDVPSPWGEAAKGLLHVKGLDCLAVRLDQRDATQCAWMGTNPGTLTAPAVFEDDKTPVTGAMDILILAERLAPLPCLLPHAHSADVEAVVNLLAAPGGLGWQRRLQQIHAALTGAQGFHPKVAAYLAPKYGYDAQTGANAGDLVVTQLKQLAHMLADKDYLVADQLTAADIYLACFVALFAPLPEAECAMNPATRTAFEAMDAETRTALDPRLLHHRDRIYATALETPLSL